MDSSSLLEALPEFRLTPEQLRLIREGSLADWAEAERSQIVRALRVTGGLDQDAAERALTRVVQRHEALHARFHDAAAEGILQIDPSLRWPFERVVLDGAELSGHGFEQRVAEFVDRPFSSEAALGRVGILSTRDRDQSLIIFVVHALITDRVGLDVLVQDWVSYYDLELTGRADESLPPPSAQLSDHLESQAEWLSTSAAAGDEAYWRGRVLGWPAPLSLATEGSPCDVELPLADALGGRLDRVAADHGVTPFVVLLAALVAELGRLGKAAEFVVFLSFSNRLESRTEALVGPLENEVFLRVTWSPQQSFGELIGAVQQAAVEAAAHCRMPLPYALRGSEVLSVGAPHVRLVLEDEPVPFRAPSITCAPFDVAQPVPATLTVRMRRGPRGLSLRVQSLADFSPDGAVLFLRSFEAFLWRAAGSSSMSLDELVQFELPAPSSRPPPSAVSPSRPPPSGPRPGSDPLRPRPRLADDLVSLVAKEGLAPSGVPRGRDMERSPAAAELDIDIVDEPVPTVPRSPRTPEPDLSVEVDLDDGGTGGDEGPSSEPLTMRQRLAQLSRPGPFHAESARAARESAPPPRAGVPTHVPLTASLHRYFARSAEGAAGLAPRPQLFYVGLEPGHDEVVIARALKAVLGVRDSLRLKFEPSARRQLSEDPELAEWRLGEALAPAQLPWGWASMDVLESTLADTVWNSQSAADYARPAVARAVMLRGQHGADGLLLALHPLCTDAVSMGLILADLGRAYDSLRRGRPKDYAAGDEPSFATWSAAQAEAAPVLSTELEYWLRLPWQQAASAWLGALPVPSRGEPVTGRYILDARLGAALRRDSRGAAKLLLAAFAHAVGTVLGLSWVGVDVERDGRAFGFGQKDYAGTAGWLSVYFPVFVRLDGTAPSAFDAVRAALGGLPHGGAGYGVLRYQSRHASSLQVLPYPSLRFRCSDLQSLGGPVGSLGQVFEVADSGPILQATPSSLGLSVTITGASVRLEWVIGAQFASSLAILGLNQALERALMDLFT